MSVRRVGSALAAALGPGTQVQHRANHPGAGRLSYAVRVGGRHLWAKVAADGAEERSLTTWAEAAPLLAERHGAPPVLDVLQVAGHTALLFPFVPAAPADRSTLRARYDEADDLLAGLHADPDLTALLGGPTTSAASFRAVWLERFAADLDVIEGYVAKDLHAFLGAEVDALGGLVDALDEPVHSPVHGDPGREHWLLDPGRLWLLGWEGLTVGDPVVDDAILRDDALGSDPHHWPDGPRYAVARRALMLGAVIDVAADWVASTDPLVRRRKEAAYLPGLEAYRDAFT